MPSAIEKKLPFSAAVDASSASVSAWRTCTGTEPAHASGGTPGGRQVVTVPDTTPAAYDAVRSRDTAGHPRTEFWVAVGATSGHASVLLPTPSRSRSALTRGVGADSAQ